MNKTELLNKVYGALIGVAYGDSMGMPSEFWTRQKIRNHFGKITDFLPAPSENEITKGLKAGEVTDDTYMTRLISELIIENNGIPDPGILAAGMLNWAELNKSKVNNLFGPSTKRALDSIMNGTPVEEAGKSGLTNGGAMRIIPVGIISNFENLDSLIENVRKSCLPTHNTNQAIAAASAIAAAVSYAVQGGDNIEKLISISLSAAKAGAQFGHQHIGAEVFRRIETSIEIAKIIDDDDKMLNEIYEVIGTGLPAVESIPAALSLVYRTNGDPVKCAEYSANIGGDTDTIGAMACGICGAFRGINSFKEETVTLLTQTNNIDFRTTAERLTQIKFLKQNG